VEFKTTLTELSLLTFVHSSSPKHPFPGAVPSFPPFSLPPSVPAFWSPKTPSRTTIRRCIHLVAPKTRGVIIHFLTNTLRRCHLRGFSPSGRFLNCPVAGLAVDLIFAIRPHPVPVKLARPRGLNSSATFDFLSNSCRLPALITLSPFQASILGICTETPPPDLVPLY